MAREITDKEHGSALTLFNNGLLTAVHAIPGFLAFLGVRCISSLIFGSSIHRKDQIARRREVGNSAFCSMEVTNLFMVCSDCGSSHDSTEETICFCKIVWLLW